MVVCGTQAPAEEAIAFARIAGAEVKWGKGTKAYRDTKSALAEGLPDETVFALQQAAIANANVFAALMDAVRVCSLGQITEALFEVGGQYRRNM